jgi:hypothetical protein
MRRTYAFGCLIAAVFTLFGIVWWVNRGGAEPPNTLAPKDSALYQRYLSKYDTQEAEIEKLRALVKAKESLWKQKQHEYAEFLEGVNAE